MKVITLWIATAALLILTACGGAETTEDQGSPGSSAPRSGASGAPRVEAAHQDKVDAAWEKAVAGENPSHDCARVKGFVAGSRTTEGSEKALHACNVEIPVRFFLTRLDEVERGDKTCQSFMMEVFTQLPAMTMDMSGLGALAERGGVSEDEAPDAARDLISTAVTEGTTDLGATDPKRQIKERIAARTTELCPDIAPTLLQP